VKLFAKLALASFLAVLAGCVPALNPLYTEKDEIFDSALLGVWAKLESKETWAFTKRDGREYHLLYTEEDGRKSEFIVHLLKIEGEMFLDLYAMKAANLQDNDYLLPLHTFMLVLEIDPKPQFSYLDPGWLKHYLEKNPTAIQHEHINDEILLTGSTPELQEFLLTHLKTKGAFSEPTNLKRQERGL